MCRLSAIRTLLFLFILAGFACKKEPASQSPTPSETQPPDPSTDPHEPPADPEIATTVGFFMEDWQARYYQEPETVVTAVKPASASLVIDADRNQVTGKVPPYLMGNNANTWMTQLVDQPVLLEHLRQSPPGIIRFPGGSISDLFFWNAEPGSLPAGAPASLIDANGGSFDAGYWYGRNTDSWTLSVDNYYKMLSLTGNQGLITINYGYARYGTGTDPVADAAHLAAEWVRYDRGRVRYWEIGNENFGSWEAGYRIATAANRDGQPELLTGSLYGRHFRVIADSMRQAAAQIGVRIYIGAVLRDGPPASWESSTYKTWNESLLPELAGVADFYVTHNYFTPYQRASAASEILASADSVPRTVMKYIKEQLRAAGAAIKPIVMDEWNIFAVDQGQMVSHVSGLHASAVWAALLQQDYGMACRWNLANAWEQGNDHGMFSQGDEPGGLPKWTPRPAFYHQYYFQQVLGDRTIAVNATDPTLKVYLSAFSSGQLGAVLINMDKKERSVELRIRNFSPGDYYYWYTLTGGTDNGEFSRKLLVNGQGPSGAAGGPANYARLAPYRAATAGGIRVAVPARAAVYLVVSDS